MNKVKLGRVHPHFPFYLNEYGMMYLKRTHGQMFIYEAFEWVGDGSAIKYTEVRHPNAKDKRVERTYWDQQVEEFDIEENHHLSTEPLWQ